MKILAISSKHYPGVTRVFENGLKLKLWDLFFIEDGIPNLLGYDGVILGAYHKNYESIIANADCKKTLLFTSSPGQSQFHELPVLERVLQLLDQKLIDILFFGSKEFYEMFKTVENIKYFPYPITLTTKHGGAK